MGKKQCSFWNVSFFWQVSSPQLLSGSVKEIWRLQKIISSEALEIINLSDQLILEIGK